MELAVSPRTEYERRRAVRQGDIARLRRVDDRVGTVGLWSASGTVLVLLVSFLSSMPSAWALVPVAVLITARIIHLRYESAIAVLEAGARHYDRGLARMDDRWIGQGREGREFEAPTHPYAGDLDLFGRGSLFELLCTVRTRAGEKSLATWLLSPGNPAEIRDRQVSVRELRDRLDLREDLSRLGDDAAAGIRPDELGAWSASPVELSPAIRRTARVLTAASMGTLVVFLLGISAYPFAAAVLAILMFNWRVSGRIGHVTELGERAERELDLLSKVLRRLSGEPFSSPRLRILQDSLRDAAVHVEELARLVQRLQSVRNELIRALAGLILWRAHCAFALENWRERWGRGIPGWLEAVGEIEALGALATYSYENPEDPFPEIVEGEGRFEGEQLGHPLLPRRTCVRNDVRLGDRPRVLIVSGSNMSGKSTLLRTVGVNATLALAGAPVRAKRLTI
ncbi:MAG TPA: DNA mismatch repair protein MutS, partial [Planctomycetota bacterium]|nr:DNA mismatch repair protein MutS [Planctomycetota bacterium]